MAVQAYPYLVMTDGTNTVTFQDGAGGLPNWPLVDPGWGPAIAGVRRNVIDGLSPYADVVEELTINIQDTTAALCMSRLSTLAQLLDQAERWWRRGESVSPVTIKYAPQGSTVASTASPYVATVLGRAEDDETSGAVLPPTWSDVGMIYEITGVRVRFLRSAVWTSAAEAASAGAVANPAVLTVTMPSTPTIAGPITLDFNGFTTAAVTGAIDIPSAYLIVGPNLDLQQAESPFSSTLAGSATYTSTADATARASGGNVGRLDHHLATLGVESVLNFVPSLSGTPTQVGVYVTYRNNTASAWTIRASGGYGLLTAASVSQIYAPTVVIPGATTNPTVLYLGTIANRYGVQYISLNIAMTALSGAGTLDLDTIVFVDRSTGEASVIAVNGGRATLGGVVAGQNTTVTVENNPSSLTAPDVRIRLSGGNRIPQTYAGPAGLNSKGATVKAIWYGTHLYGGTTPYWTTQNVSGAATLSIGAAVSRKPGHLNPE